MISIFRVHLNLLRKTRMRKTSWWRTLQFSQYNQHNFMNIWNLTSCEHFLFYLEYTRINCVMLLQWYDRIFFLDSQKYIRDAPGMFVVVIWLFTLRAKKIRYLKELLLRTASLNDFTLICIVHPDQWCQLIYIWQTCIPPTSFFLSICYNWAAAPLNN